MSNVPQRHCHIPNLQKDLDAWTLSFLHFDPSVVCKHSRGTTETASDRWSHQSSWVSNTAFVLLCSAYLPTYLPTYLSIYLRSYLPIYLSIDVYIYLSSLSIYAYSCAQLRLSSYLSAYLST